MKTPKLIQLRSVAWLLGLAVFSFCNSLSAIAAPVDESVVLTQKCKALGGVFIVYLSRNCLRMESPDVIIFAQAPTWVVTFLNLKKKAYFQSNYKTSLKGMQAAMTLFSSIVDCSSFKWRKAQGTDIAGLSSEQWCNDSQSQSQDKHSVKFWTVPMPQVAPQCAEIMAACYGIPYVGHGIPIRLTYRGTGNSLMPVGSRHFDDEGTRQQEYCWLDTISTKKMPVSTALFAIPKGFKPTKDCKEIMVQNFTHGATDFIMKDLIKNPEALFQSR